MSEQDKDGSKSFFAALYDSPPLGLSGDFDATVTRLVTKQGDKAVAGDQALQSLMISYLLSGPERQEQGRKIAASVAGIKARAVEDFTKSFPGVSLDELIEEAKSAGHDIQVLG